MTTQPLLAKAIADIQAFRVYLLVSHHQPGDFADAAAPSPNDKSTRRFLQSSVDAPGGMEYLVPVPTAHAAVSRRPHHRSLGRTLHQSATGKQATAAAQVTICKEAAAAATAAKGSLHSHDHELVRQRMRMPAGRRGDRHKKLESAI